MYLSGVQRAPVLALTALLIACGDDPMMMVGGDAGPSTVDASIGPDEDGDEWRDDLDNCPKTANTEQRDRDLDGIGDRCDTCPSTPNNGEMGTVDQSSCTPMDEVEPNDDAAGAQALSLMPMDQLSAVRGAIERPRNDQQAYDRYVIMAAAQSMVVVRVARASPDSLLEPSIEVTGGSYTSPRTAHGLFVAERQLYFSEAGTYEIAIADRRGAFGDEPKGDEAYAYELSVRAMAVDAESLTPGFKDQALRLDRAGTVRIFDMSVMQADIARFELKTELQPTFGEGIDPILVLEGADGAVIEENDEFSDRSLNARVLLEGIQAQDIRMVVDHQRIEGDVLDLTMTVDFPDANEELEPNDTLDLATPLEFCQLCETAGVLDTGSSANPDIDWFTFDAVAGQIVRFSALITQGSQADPFVAVGFQENDEFRSMYVSGNFGTTPESSSVEAIFGTAGTYYVGVVDERNLEKDMPPFNGGPLYLYKIVVELGSIFPADLLTSSATVSGAINPGGRIKRWRVMAGGATQLRIRTLRSAPLMSPRIRVFGENAIGLLGAGDESVTVDLPAAGTYIIGVSNGQRGVGGPGVDFDLSVQF